uniref:Uncharacterized protein n=1 Tax=Manihot esculenta TaxID=3983 RepID=A0A2C9W252_MANES
MVLCSLTHASLQNSNLETKIRLLFTHTDATSNTANHDSRYQPPSIAHQPLMRSPSLIPSPPSSLIMLSSITLRED